MVCTHGLMETGLWLEKTTRLARGCLSCQTSMMTGDTVAFRAASLLNADNMDELADRTWKCAKKTNLSESNVKNCLIMAKQEKTNVNLPAIYGIYC